MTKSYPSLDTMVTNSEGSWALLAIVDDLVTWKVDAGDRVGTAYVHLRDDQRETNTVPYFITSARTVSVPGMLYERFRA